MARSIEQLPRHRIPDDEEDLILWLNRLWDEGCKFRSAADIQAFWNVAFYEGHQWLYEVDTRDATSLKRLPIDSEDPNAPVMLTINKVGPRVDRCIAEITENTPGIECRPGSEEDSDINAAQVGTRISSSEDRRMQVQTLMPRTYSWVVPCGWAFWQLTWNTEDGAYVGDNPDPDLQLAGIKQALHEGNCEANIATNADVVLDPMSTDAWDARWGMRQSALTPDEVFIRYHVLPDKPISLVVVTDKLARLQTDSTYHVDQERVAVRQYWLRPNQHPDCPEGMVFTWCGNTVLEKRKRWPYKKMNRLPLIQFNYLPPRGGYFGRTPISRLIDPQVDYNRARSLEADIASRLLPKVFYADGSIEPDEVSARVEWIPYLPGPPPTQMVFDPGWMQQHETIMKRSEAEMDEAVNQSAASRGQVAGTSPAAGIMAAQEASSKPYAIPAKEMARAMEHFGWERLMLIRQYWREERLVRTWSRAGTLTVERFKAADIEGELDVQVRAESILPRSKAAQAQLAVQLMQSQVPGFDVRHFIRMIDLPGTDILTEVFDADTRQAERENQYLATRGRKAPKPVGPDAGEEAYLDFLATITKLMPWVSIRDNHPVHIESHRLHMISPEYETYPPKVKALFEAHITTHEMLQAAQQQKMMQAQQPAQPPMPGQNGQGQVPSIPELAGMQGGPGGGLSQPGVPPGIEPDLAAEAIGR